jgi:hypothetical protein
MRPCSNARAKVPQPAASRLAPRFLNWQLKQSVEESWAECKMHARNILGDGGFAQLQAELRGDATSAGRSDHADDMPTGGLTNLFGEVVPTDLFEYPIVNRKK